MKELIESPKMKLSNESSLLKYVDEDWGQLDYAQPPVKWPCCLISINRGVFDQIGIDRSATPRNRQMGEYVVSFRIANLKLSPSNAKASPEQRGNTLQIHDIIQQVHELIHGFIPAEHAKHFLRQSISHEKRDDGIQEYVVQYKISVHNV